jgi:hypothetical protein
MKEVYLKLNRRLLRAAPPHFMILKDTIIKTDFGAAFASENEDNKEGG